VQNKAQLKQLLKKLFESQKLAVLATHNDRQSYASLVAFAATTDLKHIVFATSRATRKFANLSANPRIAMLMDSRSNRNVDFRKAVAVTTIGKAVKVGPREKSNFQDLYLAKHPQLKEFIASPTCALLKVKVDEYYIVSRFQDIAELRP